MILAAGLAQLPEKLGRSACVDRTKFVASASVAGPNFFWKLRHGGVRIVAYSVPNYRNFVYRSCRGRPCAVPIWVRNDPVLTRLALVLKYFDQLAPIMQEQDPKVRPAD